jgi:hypothetical protein
MLLYDPLGSPVVFASIWIAQWTEAGAGTCVLIADRDGWRSYGESVDLATHLAVNFTRYFPESSSFPWDGLLVHHDEEIMVTVDLGSGLVAFSESLSIEIGGVIEHHRTDVPEFPLGASAARLTNIYSPCRTASLVENGKKFVGQPMVTVNGTRIDSTAYLAVAEIWEVIEQHEATDGIS